MGQVAAEESLPSPSQGHSDLTSPVFVDSAGHRLTASRMLTVLGLAVLVAVVAVIWVALVVPPGLAWQPGPSASAIAVPR